MIRCLLRWWQMRYDAVRLQDRYWAEDCWNYTEPWERS